MTRYTSSVNGDNIFLVVSTVRSFHAFALLFAARPDWEDGRFKQFGSVLHGK